MATGTKFPLQVFYDGSCRICSREMQTYRDRDSGERLIFFDISASDFDAEKYGCKAGDLMKELHVRDAAGQFHTGIAAFVRIWSGFPESPLYHLLERSVTLPGIRLGADLGYATFARLRHLLPKTGCLDGRCRLH